MERMRPIELEQFADHVREMHQDRDKGFEIEYQVSQQLPASLTLQFPVSLCVSWYPVPQH